MIEIPRPPFDFAHTRLKVFGIGGAGCNALDRVMLDGIPGADLVAINTDAQALTASVVETKVQIGQTITRGLGAGGDPEVGRTAAEEGIGEILAALADATIVFLVVGLGGGTGSGAAPVIAEITREHNAMVVVFATMPFQFEGKRRLAQALDSLAALHRRADILICFENDKIGEAVSPKANIQEAFAAADATISQCIRALVGMAQRRGPLHVGFDEVASAMSSNAFRSLFGYGEATGDNRALEALDLALRNPLLDRGRRLRDCQSAVIQIAGGQDLTLDEVQIVMEEAQRSLESDARIFFGTSVDPQLTGKLTVTIMGAIPADVAVESAPPVLEREQPATYTAEDQMREEAELGLDLEEPPIEAEPEPEPVAVEEPEGEPTPAPAPIPASPAPILKAKPVPPGTVSQRSPFAPFKRPAGSPATTAPVAPNAAPAPAKEERAEQMQFEPVNRGRFEKSEPTIVDGQDLDIPTFLRRNTRLK